MLPRVGWNSSPALPHPLEVHRPSSGPLLATGTDADPMAAFHNEICFLCTGRAAPAWCPPGLAAALQGTNWMPHTSHGTSLPRTLTSWWLSFSYSVNRFPSLAAGYQPRRRSGFFSLSWVKNALSRADSPSSHQWQWPLVTISTAPPPHWQLCWSLL